MAGKMVVGFGWNGLPFIKTQVALFIGCTKNYA